MAYKNPSKFIALIALLLLITTSQVTMGAQSQSTNSYIDYNTQRHFSQMFDHITRPFREPIKIFDVEKMVKSYDALMTVFSQEYRQKKKEQERRAAKKEQTYEEWLETPEGQEHLRQKEEQERQELEHLAELHKNRVPVQDKRTQNKMLAHVREQAQIKREQELAQEEVLDLHRAIENKHKMRLLEDTELTEEEIELTAILEDNKKFTAKSLNEHYPKNETSCDNDSIYTEIQQTYYKCAEYFSNGTLNKYHRIKKDDYDKIQDKYDEYFECKEPEVVTKNVCICPAGYDGYDCSNENQYQCYLNITDPMFYKTCDYPDSEYYIYSIHGYDPCYFLDFTQTYEVKYYLQCAPTDLKGYLTEWNEGFGYAYHDVIEMPEWENYTYAVVNEDTGFKKLYANDPVNTRIDVRDMKWLSQLKRFEQNTTDPDILNGSQEGSIIVDFKNLTDQDAHNDTMMVVGGRAYFEAYSLSNNLNCFVYKGFFDQKDYVEPTSQSYKMKQALKYIIIGGSALIVVIGIVFLFFCTSKKKSGEHMD